MADKSDEPLLPYLMRHAEMVKAREHDLGAYFGDGPTAEQADAFIASVRPFDEATDDPTPTMLWKGFKAALDTEMLWLFPERDAIGERMTAALRELQNRLGKLIEETMPEQVPAMRKIVDLSVVANAAERQVKLHGNGINWRIVLARFLYWLGGGRRSNH
jgi:nucleoside 2-deoxyribosyltransferase